MNVDFIDDSQYFATFMDDFMNDYNKRTCIVFTTKKSNNFNSLMDRGEWWKYGVGIDDNMKKIMNTLAWWRISIRFHDRRHEILLSCHETMA